MKEQAEQDILSDFLNEDFSFPCKNCGNKAECILENKSKYCEKRTDIRFQAERIA